MWDIESGSIVKTKTLGTDYDSANNSVGIIFAKYTGDGKYLLSKINTVHKDEYNRISVIESHLYLLDTATLEITKEFKDQYKEHREVFPSKTGKYFLSFISAAQYPGYAMRVTDVETGEVVLAIPGNMGTIPNVDFSSDDRFIAFPRNTSDENQGVEVWDINKKEKVYTYNNNPVVPFLALSFSNNDNYLTASDGYNFISLYRTNNFVSVEHEETIHATVSYPNPAHQSLTIEFNLVSPGLTETTVSDLSGNTIITVAKENLEAGTHSYSIDVSSLANGTYFVRIISGNYSTIQKIIINK
jgi:hypothetical protein